MTTAIGEELATLNENRIHIKGPGDLDRLVDTVRERCADAMGFDDGYRAWREEQRRQAVCDSPLRSMATKPACRWRCGSERGKMWRKSNSNGSLCR